MSKIKNVWIKIWTWVKAFSAKAWTWIKAFSAKAWVWIKKAYNITANFLRENVWAAVLGIVVAIFLFILIVQGVVKGIDKWTNKTEESSVSLKATTITTSQLMTKLNNNETFVLFIGANTCSHCKQFYKTVNTYVSSGKTVYYVDVADTSDPTLAKYYPEISERLLEGVPSDRNITELATPTTVYVEKGEFKDAIQGAVGMSGGKDYIVFCDVVEGKYVGKDAYQLSSN